MDIRAKKLQKKKKEEEIKAAAEVFKEFVSDFEESPTFSKTFLRGGILKETEEEVPGKKGETYKPSKLVEFESIISKNVQTQPPPPPPPTILPKAEEPVLPVKKKSIQSKKKTTNLEQLTEEIKRLQGMREEFHRAKRTLDGSSFGDDFKDDIDTYADGYFQSSRSYDADDPNTTNIYIGNLSTSLNEQNLCEIFGKCGPLASIKIMRPRTDEERSRGKNCGFVAYMCRKDAERAAEHFNGRELEGFELRMSWGKPIPIPCQPIYIPPALEDMLKPPPSSGLPFNAQKLKSQATFQDEVSELQEELDLSKTVVKVSIPTNRNQLLVINRMVEFVVREGPLFEAMIMNREIQNPFFNFLYDNKSPEHVYYRWRLYSILQGDHPNNWREESFQMFEGGSFWQPPPKDIFLKGMPDVLVAKMFSSEQKKNELTEVERNTLEEMIRKLIPERSSIEEAMIFCINHADMSEEIGQCLEESLSILETPLYKKIARIYLISDILHNCLANHAASYRKIFEERLPRIFKHISDCFKNIGGRLRAEQFKQRIIKCLKAWEDSEMYPNDFIIKLQSIFLGLVSEGGLETESEMPELDGVPLEKTDDLDGEPIEESVDGVPFDEDVDGIPLEEEEPMKKSTAKPSFQPMFVQSKWEMVDPETIAAQAVTTSKWDLLDQESPKDSDIDGEPLEEDGAGAQSNSSNGSDDNNNTKMDSSKQTNDDISYTGDHRSRSSPKHLKEEKTSKSYKRSHSSSHRHKSPHKKRHKSNRKH